MWHRCHPSNLTRFWEFVCYLESQASRMGHRLRASALELISIVDQISGPLCFWDSTAGCDRYLGTVFARLILGFIKSKNKVVIIMLIPMQREHPKWPCLSNLSVFVFHMISLAFLLYRSLRAGEGTWSHGT